MLKPSPFFQCKTRYTFSRSVSNSVIPLFPQKADINFVKKSFRLILERALKSYQVQHKNPPKRVVVHKTSRYWPEELRGLRKALGSIYHYDFLTLESGLTRFMRVGKGPPLRGTLIQLGERYYILFANG